MNRWPSRRSYSSNGYGCSSPATATLGGCGLVLSMRSIILNTAPKRQPSLAYTVCGWHSEDNGRVRIRVMNPFFNWLKDAGTQAMLVLLGFVAACIAAIGTIYFGRKSLTKKDLAPMEQNTAQTAEHMEKVRSHMARVDERQGEQYNAELMRETARRISIHVKGAYGNAGPMTVYFTTKDPNVVLQRARLTNESGANFGQAADCVSQAQQQFTADFRLEDIQNWYESATKHDFIGRRVLTIHADLLYGKLFVERDIPTWVQKRPFPLYSLEGNC